MPELSSFDLQPRMGNPTELALDTLIRATDAAAPPVRNALAFLVDAAVTDRKLSGKLHSALKQRLEESPDEPLPLRFGLLSELLGNLRRRDTERYLCDCAVQQYQDGASGTAALDALHAFNTMASRRTIEKLANGTIYRDRFLDRFKPSLNDSFPEKIPFWWTYAALRIFALLIESNPIVKGLSHWPQLLTTWGGATAATVATVFGAYFAILGIKSLFTSEWKRPVYNDKMTIQARKLWEQISKSDTPAVDASSALEIARCP